MNVTAAGLLAQEWIEEKVADIIEDKVNEILEKEMPMTSGANALMKYLAVDYYIIQDDNSDYITSSEYWHNQITYGNKNYKRR